MLNGTRISTQMLNLQVQNQGCGGRRSNTNVRHQGCGGTLFRAEGNFCAATTWDQHKGRRDEASYGTIQGRDCTTTEGTSRRSQTKAAATQRETLSRSPDEQAQHLHSLSERPDQLPGLHRRSCTSSFFAPNRRKAWRRSTNTAKIRRRHHHGPQNP